MWTTRKLRPKSPFHASSRISPKIKTGDERLDWSSPFDRGISLTLQVITKFIYFLWPPAVKKINLINDNTHCIRIHGNWLNLKRKTTETILRTSTPRMMVILRQGFKRISRCSLGIMKLCLSFFLWLYQFIMRQNDQNTPEAVEHDYLEGETGFFSVCDRIVLIEVWFQ